MKCRIQSILVLLLITLLVYNNSADAQSFKQDDIIITAGYGGPYSLYALDKAVNAGNLGYTDMTPLGPIYLKGEYAITNNIGMGINLAYVRASQKNTETLIDSNGRAYDYTSKATFTSISVLARMNYHFLSNSKFDPYIGVGMGFRTGTTTFSPNDPTNYFIDFSSGLGNNFPIGFDLTIGARYYISKTFGVYLELGAAKSPIQGGMVLKFNAAKKSTHNPI